MLKICAVLVTYNPDDEFVLRVEKILSQFGAAVIVDNASHGRSAAALDKAARLAGVQLERNETNCGLASALNQGVRRASQSGFEWVITFDQDTVVLPRMRDTLTKLVALQGLEDILVGSNYWDEHRRRNFIECRTGSRQCRERRTLITSGTLMPVSLFDRLGGFREDYFIDSVDHEFCLRARAHRCKVVISCEPLMRHSIGRAIRRRGWLSRLSSFNHAPIRKYFIARNTLATARAYFLREPLWALRQSWRLAFDFASILLFEEDKRSKAKAFLVGVAHGLTGRLGPIESSWPNGVR